MLVRVAALEDAEAVAKLSRELSLHHTPYHPVYHTRENAADSTLTYIKDRIQKSLSGDGLVLVAQDQEVVGYLTCSIQDRPDPNWVIKSLGHIGATYVAPAYRRRGVAAALVKEALKWLKAHEVEYVDLNVVAQNSGSVAAWTALGFKPLCYNLIQKI